MNTIQYVTAGLACLLFSVVTSAVEPTLVFDNDGKLLGARDVTIIVGTNGGIYDVDFVDGSCITLHNGCPYNGSFTNPPQTAVGGALRNLLGPILDTPHLINGCESVNECFILTMRSVSCCNQSVSGNRLEVYAGPGNDPSYISSWLINRNTDTTPLLGRTVAIWSAAASTQDDDGDGVRNGTDNCRYAANQNQVDADQDGIGNACDADFNQDCVVNAVDLGLFRLAFFGMDPLFDLSGDGVVNAVDLGVLRELYFQNYRVDNPSGVSNSCAD